MDEKEEETKNKLTENDLQEIRLRLKKYLELDNVSIIAGAGTSFHLGAPIIRTIPEALTSELDSEIKQYFSENSNPSFEDLLNCLQADRFIKENKQEDTTQIDNAIQKMQKWLFENVNTQQTEINKFYKDDKKLEINRYYYHEMLIKKLLQRPMNLKRANLFTTNYDMAFDYALDNLGVHYINGFLGVHNRTFHPESYDYDLYYPGQSVSGKVHRAEKVLRYYKLHGSLSWISTESSPSNTYGIQELSLNEVEKGIDNNSLLIYPCVTKKTFTLDLPYSELFRLFAQAIQQQQSVLICVGYSFYDEHINDIIYRALSIPSFTLIIANYMPKNASENKEIEKLKSLGDKRIIFIDNDYSTFVKFVEDIMPDLYEEEENILISNTMNNLFKCEKNDDGNIDIPSLETPIKKEDSNVTD